MAQSTDNTLLLVAALEQSDPALAASLDARNTWKSDVEVAAARVALYRKYESGDHRMAMTDQMRKMLRLVEDGTGMNSFNDNYCEVVVNKMVDRLAVTAVSGTTDEETAWIAELLDRNSFQSLQDGFYRSSCIDADAFVMVDPVTLKWSVEPAYDGFDGMVAVYDSSDFITPIWACKLWSETSAQQAEGDTNSITMKLVVYQRNSIKYYSGKPGSDEITSVAAPPEALAPISMEEPGETEDVNSADWVFGGLPIVRFVNNLNITTGEGRSAIHSAITLQDVLNRTLHSMVMASEFSAFTLLWSIGMEMDVTEITPGGVVNLVLRDKNGAVVSELSEEMAAFLAACKVGQFDATPMDQYLNQIKDIAKEISHNTSTPIYGVTTEGQISGDAMKQLEVGLLGKVERYQRANTEAVKRLIRITLALYTTFNTQVTFTNPVPESIESIHVIWKPAEILDPEKKIAMLLNLRRQAPGLFTDDFYRLEIGALLRMRPDQIQDEGKKAEAEAKKLLDAANGAQGTQPQIGVINNGNRTIKQPVRQ